MSEPATKGEKEQAERTLIVAGPAENLVSTACSSCKIRFSTLATWKRKSDGELDWFLRCTVCGHRSLGELK